MRRCTVKAPAGFIEAVDRAMYLAQSSKMLYRMVEIVIKSLEDVAVRCGIRANGWNVQGLEQERRSLDRGKAGVR